MKKCLLDKLLLLLFFKVHFLFTASQESGNKIHLSLITTGPTEEETGMGLFNSHDIIKSINENLKVENRKWVSAELATQLLRLKMKI